MIFLFALFAVSVPCRGQVGVQRIRQKCEELGTFTNMSRHCADVLCKIPWHVLGREWGLCSWRDYGYQENRTHKNCESCLS